jgi:hypothetical protein
MSVPHCTFGYHQYGTSTLDTFSSQVSNGIYTNAQPFANPIITASAFSTIQQAFSTAAADYATYGAVKKTTFTNARKTLIDTLDLLADYVDSIAQGDESVIILSGYVPSASISQSNIPLDRIDAFSVKRTNIDAEIAVEIQAINHHGTVNYFCICSEGSPLPNPILVDGQLVLENISNKVRYDFMKSRKKIFKSLQPGVVYYFYVFACNTVSVSPLSDVKSIMAA